MFSLNLLKIYKDFFLFFADSDQHLIRRNQDGAVPRLHRSLPFPSQQQPPPELQPPRRNQSVNESSTSRPRPNPVSR